MTKSKHTRRCCLATTSALTLLLLAAPILAAARSPALHDRLTELVRQDRAPALFAAFIDRGGLAYAEAAGVRPRGFSAKVTNDDLLRINSNTKAMTAMMLATLVQDGTFPQAWETTILDVFPELAQDIHENYHTVTLFELLGMQSGVKKHAGNHTDYRYASIPHVVDRRYAFLREHFSEPTAPELRESGRRDLPFWETKEEFARAESEFFGLVRELTEIPGSSVSWSTICALPAESGLEVAWPLLKEHPDVDGLYMPCNK